MAQTSLKVILAGLISRVCLTSAGARYTPSYTPQNIIEQDQNLCSSGYNQASGCQNAYLNTVQDFCLWVLAQPDPNPVTGTKEQIEVPWCMMSGYGTRLIPDGTIAGAHLVVTPDYVQVTGVGDLTTINLPGGESDWHGANSESNTVGGLVFSSAFGQLEHIHEWKSLVSDKQFCFRACKPSANASIMCQNVDDAMGCEWNMPGNYDAGVFENCLGDSAEPPGVYATSTFYQGTSVTPPPHRAPSSSSCTTYSTINHGQDILARDVASAESSSTSAPITVRSHRRSRPNRHSRHFRPSATTTYTATTITFPLSPSPSSPLFSSVDSTTQVPTSVPPSISYLHSIPQSYSSALSTTSALPSSFSLDPSYRQSLSQPSSSLSLQSPFSPSSSLLSSSSPIPSSSTLERSSFAYLSSLPPSSSQQASPSASHSFAPPSFAPSPPASSSSSQSIEVPISQPSSSIETTSIAPSSSAPSSAPSSNPQTQIGSQCPARPQVAVASLGSSGAVAAIAPLVGWEKVMLTIFALVAGSSVGVLAIL